MSYPIVSIAQPGRTTIHLSVRGPIELGRECDGIVLTDGRVSRRHVRLEPAGSDVTVVDLDSTNGTLLDGEVLSRSGILRPGGRVTIGSTVIELADESATGAPGARPTSSTEVTNPGHTSIDVVLASVEGAPDLPRLDDDRGTVTIVFSDIEASSERALELGDEAWIDVLERHNRLVAAAVDHFGGSVVKHQGDGFMLTFAGARRAIQAMSHVQGQLAELERSDDAAALRVRVGIHTGEVIDQDGDIFGKHVIYAARVANLARGGEILVSALVHEIAGARGDLRFGDAREEVLKGIDGRHVVYPVVWDRP